MRFRCLHAFFQIGLGAPSYTNRTWRGRAAPGGLTSIGPVAAQFREMKDIHYQRLLVIFQPLLRFHCWGV